VGSVERPASKLMMYRPIRRFKKKKMEVLLYYK